MAEVLTQTQAREGERFPVDQLVEFLRAHPYQLDHSKHELAEQLGVDEEFVGDVLDCLRGSPNKLPTSESFFRAIRVTAQTVWSYLAKVYLEFTERPYVTLPVTMVLTVALMLLARSAVNTGFWPLPVGNGLQTLQDVGTILGATLALLHSLVYFRHGMMRYAMYGLGVAVVVSVSSLLYMNSGRALELMNTVVPPAQTAPWLVFAGVFLSVAYFFFATVASLLGGFWQTSKADRQQKRLTRQELIDRLFYLQERLKAVRFESLGKRRNSFVAHLRTTPWIPFYGFALGLAIGAIGVLLRGMVEPGHPSIDLALQNVPVMVTIAMRVLKVFTFVGFGYLSGGVRRAIVSIVLMFAGTVCAELIPYSYFGPAYIEYIKAHGMLVEGLSQTFLVAILVGIGAHIDKRARVRQKVQEHDPAFVTAEIVEIQWRLNPSAAATCVMVADVAGSTRMKSDADPLAVEYSFRAFQDFIAAVAARRGGTVLSTAGDGAVFSFSSCAEGLYAAKEIQTKIGQFNSVTNRLPSAFRVRIGLHTGKVSAQLADVPFNELLDIAAHVEREAPVGGIAVTQSVVEAVEQERVAALKDTVDGQNVFVVLNPTLVS